MQQYKLQYLIHFFLVSRLNDEGMPKARMLTGALSACDRWFYLEQPKLGHIKFNITHLTAHLSTQFVKLFLSLHYKGMIWYRAFSQLKSISMVQSYTDHLLLRPSTIHLLKPMYNTYTSQVCIDIFTLHMLHICKETPLQNYLSKYMTQDNWNIVMKPVPI